MRQPRYYQDRPLTAVQIERTMLRTLDLLEWHTNGGVDPEDGEIIPSIAALGRDMVDKEAAYKAAFNVQQLRVTGSNKEMRTAKVEQDPGVKAKKRDHEYAEVIYTARKQYLETLRNTLDALRTMAANVRSQV